MSAQVTEAHIALSARITRENGYDPESTWNRPHVLRDAQLIADSEAKATERANVQVESLISSAKNAIPASEHPAEPTVENWAWQIRNLGEDRRLVYTERDQLRAEVERWKHGTVAQFKDAFIDELKRENTELRASCDEHAKGYFETRKRIAALETEIDRLHAINAVRESAIARAERAEADLATERARLDWLESKCPILWSLEDHATGPYWLLTDFPGYTEETASQHKTARAAIDAAMKEGAK